MVAASFGAVKIDAVKASELGFSGLGNLELSVFT